MVNAESFFRRDWLRSTGTIVGSLAALTGGAILFAQQKSRQAGKKENEKEEEVSPAEDLMREHGALKRILLIYREVINRIDVKQDFPPDAVMASAKLIRAFVEDYHEKLEQDYLFPRFEGE